MTIRIQYEIEHPDFEQLSRRGINEANRIARREALEWLQNRLKHRFDGTMQRKLRWRPEARGWAELKRHVRPESVGKRHRFTGHAERQAERSTIREPRAGGKMSAIVISDPGEGYFKGPKARQMRDELKRVAPFEVNVMSKIMRSTMLREVNKSLAERKVRKRV